MAFGLDDAIGAALKVLDKFIPDPAAKAKAEDELRDALLQWDGAQSKINEVEAAHSAIFVAGWRPFVGWTCGAAFAYHYVIQPMLLFLAALFGKSITLPAFSMESLLTVLLGLLGLGGLRTYEKHRGLAR
jgi:hypothetical protein